MRRSVVAAFAIALGLSPAAPASVTLSVRVWTGSAWGTSLGTDGALVPRIQFGVFASYTPDAQAIGSVRFNILGDESRFVAPFERSIDLASVGLGRQAPFTIGAGTPALFIDPLPAYGWRVDDSTDAANSPSIGIICGQNGPPYNFANPALLFRFDLVLSPSLTGLSVVVRPSEATASVALTAGGPATPTDIAGYESATVVFVQAPSAAIVGPVAVMLLAGRRRAGVA